MTTDPTPPIIGVMPLAEMKALSGLDMLAGMIAGRYPAPPIAMTLDFRLTEVERGRAVFQGTPTFAVYNPIGSVHDGYMATLLDSCMGCAVHSLLEPGQGYTSLEIKINFTRALTDKTGLVTATGRVLTSGRRAATAEGHLIDAQDRILAHGTTTCLVFDL